MFRINLIKPFPLWWCNYRDYIGKEYNLNKTKDYLILFSEDLYNKYTGRFILKNGELESMEVPSEDNELMGVQFNSEEDFYFSN